MIKCDSTNQQKEKQTELRRKHPAHTQNATAAHTPPSVATTHSHCRSAFCVCVCVCLRVYVCALN